MLPVVAGPDETRRQILIYSVLMVLVAAAPVVLGFGGTVYAVASTVAGAVFLALAWKVWRIREGRPADQAAKRLFHFSIFYLFLLFALLLGESAFARLIA